MTVILCFFSFSPVGPESSYTPLCIVLFFSAVKEVVEDFKRYKEDNQVNKRLVDVFSMKDGAFNAVPWKDVQVGDLIKVKDGEFFPADLVFLCSSREDGRCYVETSNLDGETNLKLRSVLTPKGNGTTKLSDAEAVTFKCVIECDPPNNSIYQFNGTMNFTDVGTTTTPISNDSVLLRGTQLRGTEWIYGIAVYTGEDSKVQQNATVVPHKRSRVEKGVNTKLLWVFFFQTIVCTFCSVGNHYNKRSRHFPYEAPEYQGFIYVSYMILYNTMIPLSMYVSMEMVRVFNSKFIDFDLEMYDETTDTPAKARNTNINEELGQIQTVLTDKTGTLTENNMVFAKCSVMGLIYGDSFPEDPTVQENSVLDEIPMSKRPLFKGDALLDHLANSSNSNQIREFITLLAVCNTVVPMKKKHDISPNNEGVQDDVIIYQAESPDEEALVIAAEELGFKLCSREGPILTVNVMGYEEKYEVLNVLPFSSDRKRMSVIVRTSTGQIKLYCKGADTVIFERLQSSVEVSQLKQATADHLAQFASEGLRTLCMGIAVLDESDYQNWNQQYKEAALSLQRRAEKLEEVAEHIERNLFLLGATAIEDKLQDGVADCIKALRAAGIAVWVLTGDKRETATSIGYASKVLTNTMELFTITDLSKSSLRKRLKEILEKRGVNLNDPFKKQNKSFSEIVHNWLRRVGFAENVLIADPDENTQNESGVSPHLPRSNSNGRKPDGAIIIDGASLAIGLEPELRYLFLTATKSVNAVICCRCSPLQKAAVVKLVSERSSLWGDGSITLAIGDGANDVPMIQKAHVGVGISGREGRQAVLASDFAIARFRMLQRLLLVHGSRSYLRISKLILYSFYKNMALSLAQFWFAFFAGFGGQMMFFDFLFTLFNAIFTALPILALAMFEQDVSESYLLKYPILYEKSRENRSFNDVHFFGWMALGVWQSMVLFFIPFFGAEPTGVGENGQMLGMWATGNISYTLLILCVTCQVALFIDFWTWVNLATVVASVVVYFIFISVYCRLYWVDPDAYGVFEKLLTCPSFYFCILVAPVTAVLPEFVLKSVKQCFFPELPQILSRFEKHEKDPNYTFGNSKSFELRKDSKYKFRNAT